MIALVHSQAAVNIFAANSQLCWLHTDTQQIHVKSNITAYLNLLQVVRGNDTRYQAQSAVVQVWLHRLLKPTVRRLIFLHLLRRSHPDCYFRWTSRRRNTQLSCKLLVEWFLSAKMALCTFFILYPFSHWLVLATVQRS